MLKGGTMYRVKMIRIKKGHRMYRYCHSICLASARLYNRTNYVIRQYATAVDRSEKGEELTENQRDIYTLVSEITRGTKFQPGRKWLTYNQLDYIFKVTDDPAYRGLPAHANQQIMKRVVRDYNSFFGALRSYKQEPEIFTGRPGMPRYKRKDSLITAVLTNQVCVIKEGKYLKFPLTGETLNVGGVEESEVLKEVQVKCHPDYFMVHIIFQRENQDEPVRENPLLEMDEKKMKKHLRDMERCSYRVAAIDVGTNNFCAIANNFGVRPLLVKGGIVKSRNYYYNKKLANMRSQAKRCNNRWSTRKISRFHDKRNRIIYDQMHKISHAVADWALNHKIQLVVLGHNKFQKQSIHLGDQNNQNFVQIPFNEFAEKLRYKLEERGIAFLETEEAWTSKADFLAMDPIPQYKKGQKPPVMSGERIHRGLYRHGNRKLSNADINAAANIMRKVLPNVKEWDTGVVDTPYAVCFA